MKATCLSDFASRDVIDSREIGELLDELESDRQAHEDAVDEAQEALDEADADEDKDETALIIDGLESDLAAAQKALAEWDEENGDDLKALQELRDEIGSEFTYGETLISEDYWPEYVEDLCKDIGDIPRDLPSYIVIDWSATADNIKVDYSEIEIDGETFFYRMS